MSFAPHNAAEEMILLTGGTGFFGRALLRHWSALHARGGAVPGVVVPSRDPHAFARSYPGLAGQPWLRLRGGDIMDVASLPDEAGFTAVIHAATDSTLGPGLPALARYDQIVQGTRNVLDWAVAHRVSRCLLTSSGGVYGPQPEHIELLTEDWLGMPDPLDVRNTYSVAKRTAEHLCALYQDRWGLQVVIARCFAFVGEDLPLDVHFAIGNFLRDALYADAIQVHGDGLALRSYLDQRDLARWLIAMVQHGRAGRAYNVGSDRAISIAALAHLVRDLIAPGKPVRVLGKASAASPRSRYVPSIQRAREELRLDVAIELEQAIVHAARRIHERLPA